MFEHLSGNVDNKKRASAQCNSGSPLTTDIPYRPKSAIKPSCPSIPIKTPSATYDVTIGSGLLRNLSQRLTKLNPGKPYRPFVITSPEIWNLWSKTLPRIFPKMGQPRQQSSSTHPANPTSASPPSNPSPKN